LTLSLAIHTVVDRRGKFVVSELCIGMDNDNDESSDFGVSERKSGALIALLAISVIVIAIVVAFIFWVRWASH